MTAIKMIPRGSMRRQRRLGRIEGSISTLALVSAIGAAVVSMTPDEIYQPAAATQESMRESSPMHFARVPPVQCTDMTAKDCMAVADPTVHYVPEPSTLWLCLVGMVGAARSRAAALLAAAWITYGRLRGMEIDDE